MADDRKIIHGVFMEDGEVITDPDRLAEVLTPELQERLEKAGSIEGNWKGKKAAKKDAEEESEKPRKSKKE
jgi:hypothetical protein